MGNEKIVGKQVLGNELVVTEEGVKQRNLIETTQYDLKQNINNYPNFPKKGVQFKDISPILQSKEAMEYILAQIKYRTQHADIIALMDARGFLFNIPGKDAIMVRKKGKLPGLVVRKRYKKEYGFDTIEIQKDAIKPGQKVAIIDDLLATGGTMNAAAKLIEKVGGEVISLINVVQLNDAYCMAARKKKKLHRYNIESLVEYDE